MSLWRGKTVPLSYLVVMGQLAETTLFMANELFDRRLPTASRERLVRLAAQSSHLSLQDNISAVVILGQMRSIIADLLELTGLDYAEARAAMPEMD